MDAPEGVARVRALASLRQVEDTVELLNSLEQTCGDRDAGGDGGHSAGEAGQGAGAGGAVPAGTVNAATPSLVVLGVEVPRRLEGVLDSLSALASREDAERLLEAGVSMWNSVLVLDRQQKVDAATEMALLAIRRVAVECMRTALRSLGGVSARFSIDEVSLLRFYTAVAKRYAGSSQGEAAVTKECFTVAFDLAAAARTAAAGAASGRAQAVGNVLGRALFELELAAAEFGWEDEEAMDVVQTHVLAAAQHLDAVPDRACYFASVLYNLGLHSYHQGHAAEAVSWLRRSIRTRTAMGDDRLDKKKQAKTARLAAVCLISTENYDEAVEFLRVAEGLAHDCAGAYLLLKVAIVMGQQDVAGLLAAALEDETVPLDVCSASLQLLTTAGRLTEAVYGYELLYKRRGLAQTPEVAAAREITQRYFQALVAVGNAQRAVEVLDDALVGVKNATLPEAIKVEESERWLSLSLDAGSSFAERQYFQLAAWVLHKMLQLKTPSMTLSPEKESVIHRLVASCCLCAFSGGAAGTFSVIAPNAVESVRAPSDAGGHAGVASVAPTPDQGVGDTSDSGVSLLPPGLWSRSSLLSAAVEHAIAAKDISGSDFAAHMLLFRAYVLRGDSDAAAAEVEDVHALPDFSADALVAAACDANKLVGAKGHSAVVSALLAVLSGVVAEEDVAVDDQADGDTLPIQEAATRKRRRRSRPHIAGFYGLVVKASVALLLESAQQDAAVPYNESLYEMLSQVLEAGLTCVRQIGTAETFGDDQESSLGFLGDVAWNCGRSAGNAKQKDHELAFFTLCDELYRLRRPTLACLQTRKIALVLCATCLLDYTDTAVVAGPDAQQQGGNAAVTVASESERINQALVAVRAAVGVIAEIQAFASADGAGAGSSQGAPQTPVTDSGMLLLCLLEVRCYARLHDASGLTGAVDRAVQLPSCTATLLEQIGWVCREAKTRFGGAHAHFAEAAVSACIAALKRALHLRLSKLPSRPGSFGGGTSGTASALSSREKRARHGAIAGLLRQLMTLTSSRLTESSWEFVQQALSLMRGDSVDFRYDLTECRWVAARTWESAQQLAQAGQHAEAARWAASVASMCESPPGRSAGLVAFADPIREFVQSLPVSAAVANEVSEIL